MLHLLLVLAGFHWGDRFDHAAHAARARQNIECSRCHKIDARFNLVMPSKRNQHQPCAGCHQKDWMPGKVCSTCHPGGQLKKSVYPPYRSDEFKVGFSHPAHVQATAAGGRCGGCHPEEDPSAGAASVKMSHAGCAVCHAAGKAAAKIDLNQCGACHQAHGQPSQLVSQVAQPSPYRVTSAFADKEVHDKEFHQGHYKRTRAKNIDVACTRCHAGLERATVLVRPPMIQCEQCHSQAARVAFDARGTQCYRCHAKREGT